MVAATGSNMKGMGWVPGARQLGVAKETKGAGAQFMWGGIKPASGQG